MRKGSRIINYIPEQYKDRARAISELEYNLREEEKCQTRVKMGWTDLELSKKVRGTRKWEKVILPEGLPEINLSGSSGKADSWSPPPGRPGQERKEKRGRESTGSPELNKQKVSRKEVDSAPDDSDYDRSDVEETDRMAKGKDEVWKETIETAELVGEATITPSKDGEGLRKTPDIGFISSITGTPSRNTPSLTHAASPILSKSCRKPMGQI